MSRPRTEPVENLQQIHTRYEDIALVIFRQEQKKKDLGSSPTGYLTFGESSKHYAYTKYGNKSVTVKRQGIDMTRVDERPIRSVVCVIM